MLLDPKNARQFLTLLVCVVSFVNVSCGGVGFREADDARTHPSSQVAREAITQIEEALAQFHSSMHRYPMTNEVNLYDSIHAYFKEPIDPSELYRNDRGKGFYIAIGSRASKIIYRYPPTVGSKEYTLYWVGPNGVDEEGEGDDLPAWDTSNVGNKFERRKLLDLRGDKHPVEISIVETGKNLFKDSVRLFVKAGDTILYSACWPIDGYFLRRPELTDLERHRIVHEELERLLNPSEFVPTDSLLQHDWRQWDELDPKSMEASEIVKRNLPMFNYYTGSSGSHGIVWSPERKKFIRVWKSA